MDFIKSYGFVLIVTLLSVIALVYSLLLQRKIKAIKVDNERLEEIQSFISEGAMAFLFREYKTLGIFVVVLFPILGFLVSWWTAICFVFGALFSALAGYVGMKAATASNAKTAYSAQKGGMGAALSVAFSGGAIMGLCVVGLGLGGLTNDGIYAAMSVLFILLSVFSLVIVFVVISRMVFYYDE